MTEPIITQFMLPITTKETVQELMQKGVDWGKTIGAIEELEKIAEEMKEERDSYDLSCKNTFNVCIELIDKHIAKLKGETK